MWRSLILCTTLQLGSFVAFPAMAAPLTGDELKQLIVGKSCTWVNGKYSGTSSYMADGSASMTGPSGSESGTWRIKGSQLCDKWKESRKGSEKCFTYTQTSPGTYKGSIGFVATCN